MGSLLPYGDHPFIDAGRVADSSGIYLFILCDCPYMMTPRRVSEPTTHVPKKFRRCRGGKKKLTRMVLALNERVNL